jgi:hypothetical protein
MIVFGPKTVTAKELKTVSNINITFIINQNQKAIEQASCGLKIQSAKEC